MKKPEKISFNSLLDNIYTELSNAHGISKIEIEFLVSDALSKTYDSYFPATVLDTGNIIITDVDNNGKIINKNVVISEKKQTEFLEHLREEIDKPKASKIRKAMPNFLGENNILYGVFLGRKGKDIIFQLYTKDKEKLTNLFALVSEENLCKIDYEKNKDSFHLLKITKKINPMYRKGLFFLCAYANDNRVFDLQLRTLLKKINTSEEKHFKVIRAYCNAVLHYSHFKFTKKNNTISIFMNNTFIPKIVIEFIQKMMKIKNGCKVIIVTKKGEQK